MKKRLLLCMGILVLICLSSSQALAEKVAVVKSTEIKPYNDALSGFKSSCRAEYREYTLSDIRSGKLQEKLESDQPDLILAIGLNALQSVRGISGTPVIYTMVSNIEDLGIKKSNITGVSMNVSGKKQLEELMRELPDVKRIGLVYDPSKTGGLYRDVKSAADARGLTVVSREVSSASDVPGAIDEVAKEAEVFWMLPDTTVLTRETLDYLLLVSLERRIPILTFSEKYLDKGAFISISIDPEDIGKQACGMARKILDSGSASGVRPESPRKAVVQINHRERLMAPQSGKKQPVTRAQVIR